MGKKGEKGGEKKKSIRMIEDARFSSVHSDPRFQNVPKHQSKVTIDSRFNRMFTDKKFSTSSAPVDKRGKPKNRNAENPLRHYYNIEQHKGADDEKKTQHESHDDEEDESHDEEEDESHDEEAANQAEEDKSGEHENSMHLHTASSDSEEFSVEDDWENFDSASTGSDTDDEDAVYSDEESDEPKEKIPEIKEETRRLAIVNMDWSQVRAVDLYVIMNSVCPKGGRILSVSVYPSEFGLKRMEEEAVKGPVGLFDSDTEDDDEEDNDEIDNEKLRDYEKSRLRYYFAVVECDTAATADAIYKDCDGFEFERTSNVLDLRFIPDEIQFTHPPRDVATEVPTKYEGLDFHTQALQQSKIHLSWDEDEPQRARTLKRNLNADQLAELELKDFLASDDGESDDSDNEVDDDGSVVAEQPDKKLDKADKYRALLQAGGGSDGDNSDNENDNEMEVTFNTGLEDISKRILEKKRDKKSETVWEANLRKQKEKKKGRKNKAKDSSEDDSDSDLEVPELVDDFFVEEPSVKDSKSGKNKRNEKLENDIEKEKEASKAELELLLAEDEGTATNVKGYNLKPKKAKGKKGKEVPAEDKIPSADYDDPRFSALFTSPLYALDPTDAQYKRSAAYARQLAQRQQKGMREEVKEMLRRKPKKETRLLSDDNTSKKYGQSHSDMSSKMEKAELSSMVRSLKRKSQQYLEASNCNTSKMVVSRQSSGLSPELSATLMSGKRRRGISKC